MKTIVLLITALCCIQLLLTPNTQSDETKYHPSEHIIVHKWGFYVAGRVAIIHHLVLENKSPIPYTNIRIRIDYYSTSPSSYGELLSFQEKVINITLPPHSKNTYIKEGIPIGIGSTEYKAKNLRIIDAKPVLATSNIKNLQIR